MVPSPCLFNFMYSSALEINCTFTPCGPTRAYSCLDLEWLSLLIIHQSTVNRLSVHGPQENVLPFTSQLKLSPTLTLGCSGNAVRVERARAPVTPWVRLQWECRSCERALAPVAPRRVITRGDRPEGYPSTSRYLDADCRSLRQFRQPSPFFVGTC